LFLRRNQPIPLHRLRTIDRGSSDAACVRRQAAQPGNGPIGQRLQLRYCTTVHAWLPIGPSSFATMCKIALVRCQCSHVRFRV
jgi:hypothetical protein